MAGLNVTCPSCKYQFEPGEVFLKEYEQQARQKLNIEWQKMKAEVEKDKSEIEQQKEELNRLKSLQEAEIQKRSQKIIEAKEAELNQQLQLEKNKLQQQIEESLRKKISADYDTQLQLLKQSAAENEEKLKQARTKELEFLQKEKALQTKEQELELELQKKLIEERAQLAEQIRKEETEKISLKETELMLRMKELEKQLEDQKKLAEEMKRKAEQGSMQLQGEVQELMLEEMLKTCFPFDKISPVGKGVKGADCIQTVCNNLGQECGKIIYESKRTKDFGGDWIEKLKADMRSQGADVAVIVTQAFPKDMDRFGEKDGVYICSFAESRSLAAILRTSILKIYSTAKSQENKGDKMHMLYHYLTGNEFNEQWAAIREGFMTMRISIQRERDAMEKLWKQREKQLEKILLNASHIKGSIEGIAGTESVNLNLIDDSEALLLE